MTAPPPHPASRAFPRWLEIPLAALALVLLILPMAAIGLLIKVDSPGPVLYGHPRAGQGGRSIRVWKFRTMVADADRRGPAVTRGGDPRITRMGAWLRRGKIDEWPQLFNVLGGSMSLVGPRPEAFAYLPDYPEQYRFLLQIRPGITDMASLSFMDEESLLREAADAEAFYRQTILPCKLAIAAEYQRTRSARQDLGLLAQTVLRLFRPRNAPRAPSAKGRPS